MSYLTKWPRATKSKPCPNCGKVRRCHVRADGQACRCYFPAQGTGWGHRQGTGDDGNGEYEIRFSDPPINPNTNDRATSGQCDRVYSRMLELCPLTQAHQEYLQASQGIDPALAQKYRLGSLPSSRGRRQKISQTLEREFGKELLLRVPGFKLGSKGEVTIAAVGSGAILIPYMDNGTVTTLRLRLDNPGKGGKYRWLSGGQDGPKVDQTAFVANPSTCRDNARAVVTEGEFKAISVAESLGVLALGVPGVGAYKLAESVLKERKISTVALAYDADQRELKEGGKSNYVAKATLKASAWIRAQGYELELLRWWTGNEEAPKGIDDAIRAGCELRTVQGKEVDGALEELAELHGIEVPVSELPTATRLSDGDEGPSVFTRALSKLEELFDFFSDNGVAYLSPGNGVAIALDSNAARNQIILKFHRATGKAPSNDTIQRLLALKTAEVILEGPYYPVFRRCGEAGGAHYLDLCRADGKVVRLTAAGWDVIDSPPEVYWRRTGSKEEELPLPLRGGDVMLLSKLVNAPEAQIRFLAAYLAAILRTGLPYPILCFEGPAGSAKTGALKISKSMVDPERALASTMPRSEQDLAIMCRSSHVIALDNIDKIKPEMSDSLCRTATGAHHRTRALYSGTDETVLELHRPVAMSGLDGIVDRPDLASRVGLMTLEEIPTEKMLEVSVVEEMRRRYHPSILGGLLDGFVAGLANLDKVDLKVKPRMLDFARFITAIEQGFPWQPGEALAVFLESQDALYDQAIGKDRVALAVVKLLEYRQQWEGTVAELLETLTPPSGGEDYWPTTAHKLSRRVVQAVPLLRAKGIGFSRVKRRHGMVFSFFYLKSKEISSQASQASRDEAVIGLETLFSTSSSVTQASQASPLLRPGQAGDAYRENGDACVTLKNGKHHTLKPHEIEVGDACDARDDNLSAKSLKKG